MSKIRYRVLGFENAENFSMKPDRDTLVLSEVFSDVEEAYNLFWTRKDVYHREVEVGELVNGKFVAKATEGITGHTGHGMFG
jgi:hypothetical protein